MAEVSGTNRWWENYLVRYFLPSVAGMIIVGWLQQNVADLTKYIPPFMLSDWKDFGTAHLFVWFLFGTLYCYIASYPILVFHATRVLDFKNIQGDLTRPWTNPYLATILFSSFAYISAWKDWPDLASISVILFASLQIFRLYKAYSIRALYGFKPGYEASIAYAYLNKLSKRRVIIEASETSTDEGTQVTQTSDQRKDLLESYRHLREHGNTAFIFLLELALCPIFLMALKHQGRYVAFSFLSMVLIIWVLPSAFVHCLAQHLERRYSLFDSTP